MDKKLEETTNSKNEKFQTNKGDPNHPNCRKCAHRVALLFHYHPDVLLDKLARKSVRESYCTKMKRFIMRENSNTCPFKAFEKKTIKVSSK